MTRCDAVVVGTGHNGLVATASLARAGQKVLVLEARDRVGGAATTGEPWPGYRVSTAAPRRRRGRSCATCGAGADGGAAPLAKRGRNGRSPAPVKTPAPAALAPAPFPPAPEPHSLFEDVLAILTAAAFVSLGSGLIGQARLLTGGTFGIALLLTRLTPLSFGQLYLLINLPFFWLGVRQMGWRFTWKTFAAIGLVSFGADHLKDVVRFADLAPAYAAVMGGLLMGIGLLILFRHGASLGGLNILAIWLQERRAVRAGTFQMAVDSAIVVASFFVVTPRVLALSVLGAVALNVVLAVNHRPGRYLGA